MTSAFEEPFFMGAIDQSQCGDFRGASLISATAFLQQPIQSFYRHRNIARRVRVCISACRSGLLLTNVGRLAASRSLNGGLQQKPSGDPATITDRTKQKVQLPEHACVSRPAEPTIES